jgi:hypothetical protein
MTTDMVTEAKTLAAEIEAYRQQSEEDFQEELKKMDADS